MSTAKLEVTRTGSGVRIGYDGRPMVVHTGAGIPLGGRWWWSFDGSLRLVDASEHDGSDRLGAYTALALTYTDQEGPLIRQTWKTYAGDASVVVETTALRDLWGAALADSFFHTTFNSPVVHLADGLGYLVYTWGLADHEEVGIGGHFPDAVVAADLDSLPERLRRADFSPLTDVHQRGEKPFAPLIAYDHQERTLVMAPLDHWLISPLRLLLTPSGVGVARGFHGGVDTIAAGTTTRTALVFGQGVAATMQQWGDLLLRLSGKRRGQGRDSLLVRSLGFWNCYGSYYAELFRPTDATTLRALSTSFRETGVPVRYVGLDLWYHYDQVGFARRYQPDAVKYPQGLKAVCAETGLPFLLHMSAFDLANGYLDSYPFVVEEGSSYPVDPRLYRDLAREFKDWGALGIWSDFLRTQLQHCRSLRCHLGSAEGWFDGLIRSMAQEGLEVMLCMPTIGHYLASTQYENVIAVRTSTDYVNHQRGQVAMLHHLEEFQRALNSPQRNLRQNLLLSFLAWAVGLAPSYDVFLTNQHHPEGFAEPDAPRQALARALSAGIVGIGDKLGQVDREIVDHLAFPDGTLAQPDHPPHPVVATLQSEATAFYTTTSISGYRWTYVALFNLAEDTRAYQLDLRPFLQGTASVVYDYGAGEPVAASQLLAGLAGALQPGEYRYWVIAPQASGLYLLGFLDKYVTMSGRQVQKVATDLAGVTLEMELPAGRSYTFAVSLAGDRVGAPLAVSGRGTQGHAVTSLGGLTYIDFWVDAPRCSLVLRG
jgi:hypothetical protein